MQSVALSVTAGAELVRRSGNDAPRRQLGIQYVRRALQLDPGHSQARRLLFAFGDDERTLKRRQTIRLKQAQLAGGVIERKVREGEGLSAVEAEKLRTFEYDAIASLPDSERLVALGGLADFSYSWAEHLAYSAKDDAAAKTAKCAAAQKDWRKIDLVSPESKK